MAKYELSDQQVNALLVIIDNADIKGKAAPAILNLKQALSRPIKEEKCDEAIKDTTS